MKTENFDFKSHPLYDCYMALYTQAVSENFLFYQKYRVVFTPADLLEQWELGRLLLPLDQWVLVSGLVAIKLYAKQMERYRQEAELLQCSFDALLDWHSKQIKNQKPSSNG